MILIKALIFTYIFKPLVRATYHLNNWCLYNEQGRPDYELHGIEGVNDLIANKAKLQKFAKKLKFDLGK